MAAQKGSRKAAAISNSTAMRSNSRQPVVMLDDGWCLRCCASNSINN